MSPRDEVRATGADEWDDAATRDGQSSDEQEHDARRVTDAYGVALVVLLFSVLGLVASGALIGNAAVYAAVALQMVALAVTLRVSGVRRAWLMAAAPVLFVVFAGALVSAAFWGRTGDIIAQFAWLILVLSTVVAITKRLSSYRRITMQMILGLLCIYLLTGITFALGYGIISTLDPAAFSASMGGISGALYLSFITLTTVGFGDLVAVTPIARAAVVTEAILGQLYLVSVVSLAVGRLGAVRRQASH